MVYAHIVILFSIKKKEILTYDTTWMHIEDIMLINRPVTKRQILYNSTYLSEIVRVVKSIETESRMVSASG